MLKLPSCIRIFKVPSPCLPAYFSFQILRGSLPKTGPLRFGSENQFPLNFAHEYILVQK